jgi:hypothetical protein
MLRMRAARFDLARFDRFPSDPWLALVAARGSWGGTLRSQCCEHSAYVASLAGQPGLPAKPVMRGAGQVGQERSPAMRLAGQVGQERSPAKNETSGAGGAGAVACYEGRGAGGAGAVACYEGRGEGGTGAVAEAVLRVAGQLGQERSPGLEDLRAFVMDRTAYWGDEISLRVFADSFKVPPRRHGNTAARHHRAPCRRAPRAARRTAAPHAVPPRRTPQRTARRNALHMEHRTPHGVLV